VWHRGRSRPKSSKPEDNNTVELFRNQFDPRLFRIAAIIIAVVGCLANLYVLLALLLSKNSRASNVNVFITHQTILDLATCAFLFLSLVINPDTGTNYSLALFMCWFFKSFAVSVSVGNASVGGLMVITIERYVKIVHSVAYRNRYRPWMTRVGIRG